MSNHYLTNNQKRACISIFPMIKSKYPSVRKGERTMKIDMIIDPKKTLTFGDVEIDIEGTTPLVEQYVEELLYVPHKDDDGRYAAGREYVKRLISCSVKDVRGIEINGVDFKIKFKNSKIQEMDENSYNILMRVFDAYIKADFVAPILDFYKTNKAGIQGIGMVEEDKKKD